MRSGCRQEIHGNKYTAFKQGIKWILAKNPMENEPLSALHRHSMHTPMIFRGNILRGKNVMGMEVTDESSFHGSDQGHARRADS